MALSNKQRAFVEHYLACYNATEAARRAGYSERSARAIGAENLTKPDIAAAISQRLRETAMSADEVLMRLAQTARGDISDFWELEGGEPRLALDGERAQGKLHLIKKLKVKRTQTTTQNAVIETTETEIDLYDAQAAQRLIGQHHRLFVDRVELSGADGEPVPISIVKMPVDEL